MTRMERMRTFERAALEKHPRSFVAYDGSTGSVVAHSRKLGPTFDKAKKIIAKTGADIRIAKDPEAEVICLRSGREGCVIRASTQPCFR